MDNWISVKDDLPKQIGNYLVFIDDINAIAWTFFNSNKKWCGQNEYYNQVTHWQPLPPPPKAD